MIELIRNRLDRSSNDHERVNSSGLTRSRSSRDVGPLTFPFERRGTRRTQHRTRSSVVIKTRTLLLRARFDAIHTNARTIKLSATRLYK